MQLMMLVNGTLMWSVTLRLCTARHSFLLNNHFCLLLICIPSSSLVLPIPVHSSQYHNHSCQHHDGSSGTESLNESLSGLQMKLWGTPEFRECQRNWAARCDIDFIISPAFRHVWNLEPGTCGSAAAWSQLDDYNTVGRISRHHENTGAC